MCNPDPDPHEDFCPDPDPDPDPQKKCGSETLVYFRSHFRAKKLFDDSHLNKKNTHYI